ncbi:MAG: 50S ribosomal protein L3 N(5)-glutamine methyltransferase [Pseudomonadota bacterium]
MNESIKLTSIQLRGLIDEVSILLESQSLSFGQGLQSARDEAAYLVSFVAGLPPDFSFDMDNKVLTKQEIELIEQHLEKRIFQRQPLAYILGQTWLSGVPFLVNQNTLIPRSPIAEMIRDRFVPWRFEQPKRILELCTGCGCLGILAALEFENAKVDITDIDQQALNVAHENILLHKLEKRVIALNSDVYDQIPPSQYDIILANPPYVPQSECAYLPAEFKYEPVHALFSGQDGLDIPKRILTGATQFLAPNGILILEVGQSAMNLQVCYPQHQFTWHELDDGGEGVCVLTRDECQLIFETAMKQQEN